MELGCGGFNLHIIDVYLHSYAYLLLEHPVYQYLVGGFCVLVSKRHHPIAIGSVRCDERGLFLVVWVHTELVVTGEGIHKTEKFMACCGVHDEVDPRQREAVLWACFVYVGESIQSRHLPFAFLTSTTLANHSGYSTSLIAPAWRSFPTSSLMAFCLFGAKLLRFFLTGLKDGLVFSLCVITTGSIPPMSACFHVKKSLFCLKN